MNRLYSKHNSAGMGGLLLVLLLGIVIIAVIYFARSGPDGKSYVETTITRINILR